MSQTPLPRFNQDIRWGDVPTLHGYNSKELVSVLNKELRRGVVDNAVNAAMELLQTSKAHEGKLWQRLVTVAAEDIGLGDTNAYVEIASLYAQLGEPGASPEQLAQQAVIRLCTAVKDRSADEVFNYALATTLARYRESPFYAQGSIAIPNKSNTTFLGTPLAQALHQLTGFMQTKELSEAVCLAVDICFGGYECEQLAWAQVWQLASAKLPQWIAFVTAGQHLSQLMKQGKNDRYMALVVAITGIILDVQPPDYIFPTLFIHRAMPRIPDYALDMHAQTNRSFKPTVDDFRRFWEEGSVLSNQQHVIGDTYRNWILAHLEQFVAVRAIRESVSFTD